MTVPGPDDERPHPPGATSAWTETWEWRLVALDGSIAVVAAVVVRPGDSRVSYLAAILGPGRPTVGVVEHDVAVPRSGSLELRASGLWADHICEAPLSHWTLGLEAFGLAFEVPEDAVGHGRGELVPAGWDLEWEDDSSPRPLEDGSGYLCRGEAHGEVLVGVERLDLDAAHGHRLHRWGTGPRLPPWWGRGAEVGEGSLTASAPAVARAVADDGTGSLVEWALAPADSGADAPAVVSRPWRRPGPTV